MPAHINARQVLLKAIKEKVAFIPGGGFFPNSQRENTMRLNFSTMSDEKITEGIERLGHVLKKEIVNARKHLSKVPKTPCREEEGPNRPKS